MTCASSMHAMIRTAPPQAEQVSMSIRKTRFRRRAQVIAARRSNDVGSPAPTAVACRPLFPRAAGVTRARYLLSGANTP